jgi:hypothetical protein
VKGVQHILKAGHHLLRLINEVLEIARIEAGRENFSLEPVALAPALQEAFALVRPVAQQQGVSLVEGDARGEPWPERAYVHADRQRLTQVLLAIAIFWMGQIDPRVDPWMTALAAVIVAFLSASQDIVIDAYLNEYLPQDEQGHGAAATQVGYRFGLLLAGAGAVGMSDFVSWPIVFSVLSAAMVVAAVVTLFVPEPKVTVQHGKRAALLAHCLEIAGIIQSNLEVAWVLGVGLPQ